MNFVETESPLLSTPAAHSRLTELAETAAPTKSICTRTLFTSMLLTMVVFSFTLTGMMTACSWIADQYIVPKVTARAKEFANPLPSAPGATAESTSADASASLR